MIERLLIGGAIFGAMVLIVLGYLRVLAAPRSGGTHKHIEFGKWERVSRCRRSGRKW